MSEPGRWWVRTKSYDGSLVKRDRDRLCCDYEREPQRLEAFVEVIEAEPVLARIKELELQLKEANEALSWYADEKNWMTTRKDELHEARMTIAQDPDSFGVCSEPGLASTLLLIGGKRARAYLKKWEGEK